MSNALVDINGQAGQSGVFDVTLRRPSQVAFTIRRAGVGASFVPFWVVDDCGQYPKFVGGGAGPWGHTFTLTPSQVTTSAPAGQQLTYAMTVRNTGERDATAASVVNTIPDSTTVVSATASQGSCSGTVPIICNLGPLNSQATATVSIVVQSSVPGAVYNSTYVTSDAYDSQSVDNTLTLTTSVNPVGGGPPNALPAARPMPTVSGNPAALPVPRPNVPTGGTPAALPGAR
jgi:uncharacterized repeat protein (TIGR01451 family)